MRKNAFLPYSFKKQRGISLIEALIVLTIIGFGFLSLARFQMSVFESTDSARQRSEATRLARQKIEQIRSFEQIASQAGKIAYNDYAETVAYPAKLPSATLPGPQQESIPTTYLTNASYTRTWWVTQATEGNMIMLSVEVSWPNRQGVTEAVTLESMLAKAEPKESSGIHFPPAGSPVKKPLDRNLNVPVPAVTLSGGKSGFVPPGATDFYYVFDNSSGVVTNVCQGSLPAAGGTGCTDNSTNALVISGYINFKTGNQPCSDIGKNGCSASEPLNVTVIAEPRCPDNTLPSSGACTYPDLMPSQPSWKCTNAIAPSSSNQQNPPLMYTCVVTTLDRGDGEKPRHVWAGQIKLGNAIGTGTNAGTITGGNYKVCRYSDNYDKSGITSGNPVGVTGDSNVDHPSIYGLISGLTAGMPLPGYMSESLENQNYLIISGDKNCPTTTGYKTMQHQP